MDKLKIGMIILFGLMGLSIIYSDISYNHICKDVQVDKDMNISEFTNLGLASGLKNSVCIYPSVGTAKDYRSMEDIPKPYVLFYEGEFNVLMFILKLLSIISVIGLYFLVQINEFSFDLRRMIEPFQAFCATSMVLCVLILSIFFLLFLGVF